jgi:hypothetical protein
VKSRLVLLFLLVLQPLQGMKNNNRALTTSSASSLMRTVGSYVGSYGKPVILSLLPLAVGCASLQNASMPDAHYFPTDQEPYGGVISTIVIGSVGVAVGIVWI